MYLKTILEVVKILQIPKKYINFFLVGIVLFNLILISHRMSFNLGLFKESLSPGAGLKQSMHGNQYYVFDIKNIIDEYDLKDFRLSNSFNHKSRNQRPVEVIYPIKIKENSRNLFLYGEEINKDELEDCELIKKIKKISYYECK